MKLSFDYGTETIEFTVVFRKRKTLSIEVEPPNIITVIAPLGTPEDQILEAVKGKAKWIVQKLFEIRQIEHRRSAKQYVNGEAFTYLGRNYSLQIVIDEVVRVPEAKLIRGKLTVFTQNKDETIIRTAVENWYHDRAKEKITERVAYYQPFFDVQPKRIVIKDQLKRWGSCTKGKELLFNWKSVMAPSPVLDYIVVHEMCHLVHMNHTDEFWKLLKKVLPDYDERKNWLKNNGIKFDI